MLCLFVKNRASGDSGASRPCGIDVNIVLTVLGRRRISRPVRRLRLDRVGLVNARLRYAHFAEADLHFADLTDAMLPGADLTRADLTGTSLRRTVLVETKSLPGRSAGRGIGEDHGRAGRPARDGPDQS